MPTIESAPTLKFLGGAAIQSGNTPLGGAAAHRHRLALLALLAVGGRPMSRDKLIAFLWPERDDEHGRNLLKVAVHELRKRLGEQSIRSIGDQLSMDMTVVRCDVTDFDAAIAAGDLEKAAALYGGPFLDGFYLKEAPEFERWTDGERARLANSYGRALDQLAASAEQRGDAQAAARWMRARSVQDPLRSDVAIRFMRALAAAGDRVAAIRHAEIHASLRRQDISVEPDPAIAKFARELAATPTSLVAPPSQPASQMATQPATQLATQPSTQPAHGYRDNYTPTVVSARAVQADDLMLVARPQASEGHRAPRWRGVRWPGWRVAIGSAIAIGALGALVAGYMRANAMVAACPAGAPLPCAEPTVALAASGANGANGANGASGAMDANVIAIFPFRVTGADPSLAYLRDGMAELLAAEFTGEGGARAVDPGTVLRSWSRAGGASADVDRDAALRLARDMGAGQVLLGAVVGRPNRVTISATIVNTSNGTVRVPSVLVEGAADSLASVVGTVAARLLSRGTGGWRLSSNDPGTTSADALRAFVAGRASYRAGNLNASFKSFARALEIDSSFVLAAYWLTVNAGLARAVSEADAERAARLVWRQRARLSHDQRMLLEAHLGPHGPGGQDNAADVHEAMERAANHLTASAEAWHLLGDSYFHRGAMLGHEDWLARARRAFERSVALDSALGSVSHLATMAFIERDMATHARWLQLLERLAPEHGYTIREQYAAAVVSGSAATLRAARERYVRYGDPYRDSYDGIDWIVGLNLPRGEVDSLLAYLVKFATTDAQRLRVFNYINSAAINGGQPARAEEARRRYTTSNDLHHNFGLLTYAENDSAAAELLAVNPTLGVIGLERKCEVALSRLRRVDTTGAAATAAELRVVKDPDYPDAQVCAALITAIVTSLRPGAGVAMLVRADSMLRTYPAGMPPIWNYDLALAFARRGEYGAAAATARRRLLQRSARLAVSLRDEGRWALLAGDTANAIRAWRRYTGMREHAEPPIQAEVAGLRAELARLEAGRQRK